MKVNEILPMLGERSLELKDRYREAVMPGNRTAGSAAVTRHKLKRDICIIGLCTELMQALESLGKGDMEIKEVDSLIGLERLLGIKSL